MMFGRRSDTSKKRRILFVERAFQFRFIARVTAVAVLGTVLTGGLMYLLADREFGRAFFSAHYQARSSWEILLPAVLISSFVSMCIVAFAAAVLTSYDSHRIGGPLYRFKINLRAIGEGDLTQVTRLRHGDELQPLIDAMNEMTSGIRSRLHDAKVAEEELRILVAELHGLIEAGGALGQGELARIVALDERIRNALGRFRMDA